MIYIIRMQIMLDLDLVIGINYTEVSAFCSTGCGTTEDSTTYDNQSD